MFPKFSLSEKKSKKIIRLKILKCIDEIASNIENSPSIDESYLNEVKNLDHLIQAYNRARINRASRRLYASLAFMLTAIVVASLLFIRVRHTDVVLDLQVVEAAFKLSHEQYISAPFAAKKISATGFDRIVVPPGVPPFSIPNSGIKNTPTRISLHAQLPKKLSISPIVLPEKTRVYIGPVGSDGTFMISISENTKPFTIPVTIPKIVNISGSSVSEHQIDVGRIRPVEFISATHENFDLTIYPTGENKSIFLNEIMINDFSILRFRDEEGAIPRVVSAVKSGDIFFQALDSKPHHLSPNDHFSINIQKGTIANIIMNANDISLRIVATVNSIRTGNPGNDRDLMPRLLEWLIARHEIELFWGATLYIFLIIFGTMKRWELI